MRAMKDSGVEWIGEIPVGWDIRRNKTLFYQLEDRAGVGKYELLSVSEYYGVGLKKEKISGDDFLTRAENLENYKVCKIDDLVINIMLAWKKGLGVSNYNGIVSPSYCVYRKKSQKVYPKYYHYLFRTDVCADYFKQYSRGIIDSRLRLYPDVFFSLYSPVPNLELQTRIATFLDKKCTAIDSAIEKQRASIDKLKEYRQAVITEAVTKGLNPDVPMKDSGVEWIGEIPNQWKIMAIGYDIAKIESGTSVNAAYYSATETEKGVLKTSCVYNFSFDPNENKCVEEYDSERVSCPLKKDTIIVSRMNTPELVGACGYVKESSDNIYLPDRLWQISFLGKINPEYAWRYLCSTGVRWILGQVATGSSNSMKNLSQEQFKKIAMPLPSLSEQHEIAAYLDQKCTAIDEAVSKKETLIDKMTEYKKSLIYEAVTGKIEVSELSA